MSPFLPPPYLGSHTEKGWVPGDWVYLKNTDPTDNLLLQGENLIYLGRGTAPDDIFWGHIANKTVIERTPYWIKLVSAFTPGDGEPEWSDQVIFPKVGLKR